jgi:hypothetical protein
MENFSGCRSDKGNTIILESKEVKNPVHVRYD